MKTLKEFMTREFPKLNKNSNLKDAIIAFRESRLEGLPIVDEQDKLLALFTKTNLMDSLLAGVNLGVKVYDFAVKKVGVLYQEERLKEVIRIVSKSPLGMGVVVDGQEKVVGLLTKTNMVRILLETAQELSEKIETLNDYLEEENFKEVFDLVQDGIVVVDREGKVINANKVFAEIMGISGVELIGKELSEIFPGSRLKVVAKTGVAEISEIFHYKNNWYLVTRKPLFKNGELIGAVGKVVNQNLLELKHLLAKVENLEKQVEYLKNQEELVLPQLITASPKMQELLDEVKILANSRSTVLLQGESGAGKEVFARMIHYQGANQNKPFIKINCAAIPENLLEAELFGYEPGAFTGANPRGKAGKFELAKDGTIFLDEIGELSPTMQAKLLRVLQDREFERVGGTKTLNMRARVVAATNKNLEGAVARGEFRLDLYYRLNVFTLKIPPLRERPEDILLLSEYFMEKYKRMYGQNITALDYKVKTLFLSYSWPGNVRELENTLERAVQVCVGGVIKLEHLPAYLKESLISEDKGLYRTSLLEAEKEIILRTIRRTGGNKAKAAKLLGISRSQLYEKLKNIDF